MLKTLHVGVDISHYRHDIALVSDEGNRLGKPFTIVNNRPGAEMLVERLLTMAGEYDRILIGMEATDLLWYHLQRYLSANPRLAPYQVRVVTFNPKLIHGFRKAYTAMEKTDPGDAFLIAERLRFGHLPEYPGPEPRYFPLQRLTRYRCQLVHSLVRTKTQALSLLFLIASEYGRLAPFSDHFGAASMAVLAEYKGLDELASASLEELSAFIDHHGRHGFDDPQKPARVLQQVAADSFRLDEDAVEPVHFALRSALEHVKFLNHELQALDRRIAKEAARFPNTLLTVPGLGPVYVAGLIAEIAGIGRFPNDSALAKHAGLWWPRDQSGDFESEERPLSKAGNPYLRYYLCEAANSLRMHNEEYRRYYELKYKETPKHAHKRATVLTARKLVRLVDALLRKGQIYAAPGAISPSKPKR